MKKFRSIASLLLAVVLLFLCVPQVPQVEAVAEKTGDFTGDGIVTEEDVISFCGTPWIRKAIL